MITAAVCARAGSLTILDKNLEVVAGQSLLTRAIAKASLARAIQSIVVSTDYPADLVRAHACGVPVTYRQRPPRLRGPLVPKMAVWRHLAADMPRHALSMLVDIDVSRPLTLPIDIEGVIESAAAHGYDGALAVAPSPKTPWQDILVIGPDGVDVAQRIDGKAVTARQQAPNCFEYGGILAMRVPALLADPEDWTDLRLRPFVIPWVRAYDIDTRTDLAIVRQVLAPQVVA